MSKSNFITLAFIMVLSCKEAIPKIEISAKTNEITVIKPIDKSKHKNFSYMVDKNKVNGNLTTNTYHNELLQFGGYVEGKKHSLHKYYSGKENLLYEILYEENEIIDQTINVYDLNGKPLYDIAYKDGKPINYTEKLKIKLPKQLKDQIILSNNRWFLVNSNPVTGDFNSDGIKDFALKYRDDYKYMFVAFISNPRTKTWVKIFQNDYKSKEVLDKFNFKDSPHGIFLEKIEGLDCLGDGNGTIIYFDEKINAFKYYVYD